MINYQKPVVDCVRPNLSKQVKQQDIEKAFKVKEMNCNLPPFNEDIVDDEYERSREEDLIN